VVGELAEACHAAGFRFGLYYSQPNWRHPDAFTPDRHDRYLDYLKRQVSELASNYGRLDLFWFDGLGKPAKDYDGEALVKIIRGHQPAIIINNRTGLPEDYDTPEQHVGAYQDNRPWESCITLCRQWSWKPGDELKSLQECVWTLVSCAGGDGNLLLNVGPMPDGAIEPRQATRLKEMGAWLASHGESIYGTRGGPWMPGKNLASTRRGSTVFLHVQQVGAGPLQLPDLARRVKTATLLDGRPVRFTQENGMLNFHLDPLHADPIDTIVRLTLEGSAMDLPVHALAGQVKATCSNVYQGQGEEFGPQQAFDGNPATRWATDAGTKQAWIAADLGRPTTLRGVRIVESHPGRVRRFEFQCREGEAWRSIFAGTTLGESLKQQFDPVTTREVRLVILEADEGPTIAEIELIEEGTSK
jgi:alpha-L-fucosidase